VSQIVDAPEWRDPDGELCWFPVAVAEVVQVEVAAARRGKQQIRLAAAWQLLECLQRDLLERDGGDAALGLGGL
jgi:hypothetical protein